MKVYTYDYANACVVERECEVFGYPHNDSSGAQQYVNTHFRTRLEAAEKLVSETQAGVSMCARRREDARARLDAVTVELADCAERLVKARDVLEDIEREERA